MNKIELYTRLCYVCLALCVLCLIAAAVLFVYYDIKNVIGYLSGRSAKREIRELEEESAASGRLAGRRKSAGKKEDRAQEKAETKPAQPIETEALKKERISEAQKTELPMNGQFQRKYRDADAGEQATELLGQRRKNGKENRASFVLQREIIIVHTDEKI